MQKKAILLAIGDELLNGNTQDTNSYYIINKLNELNIQCLYAVQIGDSKADIIQHLAFAVSQQVDYIFTTGGLGPTADDLTLAAIAEFSEDQLIVFPTIKEALEKRFTTAPNYNQGIEKQSLYPSKALIIPNRLGTASGCITAVKKSQIYALPGVPFEMKAMLEENIMPNLSKHNNEKVIDDYWLIGRMGETKIEAEIQEILTKYSHSIQAAYLPQLGYVKLHLISIGQDYNDAKSLIKEKLQQFIIAETDQPLNALFLDLCEKHNLTIGCGESCSGGSLGSGITDIAGASKYYFGTIGAYANSVKEELLKVDKQILTTYGAVSEETVTAMAHGVCNQLHTDVAITTSGILGPSGATPTKPVGLVWIGIKIKDKIFTFKHLFPYDRLQNKQLTINHAYIYFILECKQLYK